MKEKLLTGWTFQRLLFLMVGLLIVGQSLAAKQWIGVSLVAFLILMALLSLGCASGSCKR